MSVIPVVAGATLGAVAAVRIATVVSLLWILAAAGFDMLCRHLPDVLVVLAVLPTAMAAAVLTLQGSTTAVSGPGIGAGAWAVPLLLVHIVRPDALGFGDVKAAGAVGAVLGLTQQLAIVALGLVAATLGVVAAGTRTSRRDVALGPYLAGGAVTSLAIGSLARGVS